MQSEVLLYLRDVLGVSEILLPPQDQNSSVRSSPEAGLKIEAEAPFFEVIGEQPCLFLWLDQSPQPSSHEILAKMMSAIHVTSYVLFWGEPEQLESAFGPQPGAGINFSGREVSVAGMDLRPSLPLRDLLEGDPSQILANKKKVWAQLQQLKSEMENRK